MLALANRRLEALSNTAIIVCFVMPAMLFLIILGAFAIVLTGEITSRQYIQFYGIVVGSGFVTFIALIFSDIGCGAIVEVMRKRREGWPLFLCLLYYLAGFVLPRIFGFSY